MRLTGTCASPTARQAKALVTSCSSLPGSHAVRSLPELPSIQGWFEAMTSLGRLIYLRPAGHGRSDPIPAMPTLELWADSIAAVLDDLGSSEAVLVAIDGTFPKRRCSQPHIHPARARWSCSRATRIRLSNAPMESTSRKSSLPMSPCGARGSLRVSRIRTCRGTRKFGQPGHGTNVSAASPGTVTFMLSLIAELDVRALLPTVRVPTLVVHHADDPFVPPELGKYVADHIPGAKYVELPGRNVYHFVEPWRESFQEIAEFLTGASGRGGR